MSGDTDQYTPASNIAGTSNCTEVGHETRRYASAPSIVTASDRTVESVRLREDLLTPPSEWRNWLRRSGRRSSSEGCARSADTHVLRRKPPAMLRDAEVCWATLGPMPTLLGFQYGKYASWFGPSDLFRKPGTILPGQWKGDGPESPLLALGKCPTRQGRERTVDAIWKCIGILYATSLEPSAPTPSVPPDML
jgi:hypothetical protein